MTLLHHCSTMVLTRWTAYWGRVWDPAPRSGERPPHRGQLIAQWHELQAQCATETAARNQTIADLESSLQEALVRVRKLGGELEGLYQERTAQSFQVGAEQDRLRAALADCCPVAVEMFLTRIMGEIECWEKAQSVESGVLGRLAALRRAREQADALRGAPMAAAEILNAVGRLEQNLPAVSPELMRRHGVAPTEGGHRGTR